ncbi:hypothetical protein ACHAW6_004944 [Cyclotella cf. meneghiniana]
MIFQALKKSTISSSLLVQSRGKLTARHNGHFHTAVAVASSPSGVAVRSSFAADRAITKIHRNMGIASNAFSSMASSNYINMNHTYVMRVPTGGVAAFSRLPEGNPSTMAFLGLRNKSSGAAFRVQCDDEEIAPVASVEGGRNGARLDAVGGGGRTVQEAWMVNLGRGDDEWLTGPRGRDWFTGKAPDVCPGVDKDGVIRSLPLPNLSKVTRQSARDYFDNSWTLFETLFAGLKGEEPFYRPPIHGLRHPQIFYYGHTPCLYINKLRVAGVLSKPVHAYFESIFEVGVDEMLWDDMHKNDMVWPTVREVHEYRKDVYDTVVEAIMTHPSLDDNGGSKPLVVNQDHPMWALFMGFEHERIHLETSSVLFAETPIELVQRPRNWPPLHPSVNVNHPGKKTRPLEGVDYPSNTMIPVKGRTIHLGKPLDFPSYGWDNEYGERTVEVPNFQASEHMVTNGEFWHFVADGGYRNKDYWCDDGWAWRTHRNMKWPFFWTAAGPQGSHEYILRCIFEEIPMRWDWPCNVTYYESKAYCRWKTTKNGSPCSKPFRVLTEAEHHVLRHQEHNLDAARASVLSDKVMTTSGEDFPYEATGAANLNMAYSSHSPVDQFQASHTGHRDVVGNAWEWTEDHFNPLKNFEVHHVYDDFSTPCFDGKHSMIVGGSFMSTGDEASVFARFHFRPHFLQFSGFRLVASDDNAPATHLFPGAFSGQAAARNEEEACNKPIPTSSNVYESDELLGMYLGLHFPLSGSNEGVQPIIDHGAYTPNHGLRFPQRVAELLCSLKPTKSNNRALDIGCAVGGASFELAKSFDHVEAGNFIAAAKRIQAGEQLSFDIPIEGHISKKVSVIQEPGVDSSIMSKVNFFQGDACSLSDYAENRYDFGTFDGVILSNLLCRLPDPSACLNAMPKIVNPGGVVVMVTPFSWLEEFTPKSRWLGGFHDPVSGEPMWSKDKLKQLMEGLGFEKIHEEQMPLVIREHRRKYQYIISEATGWRML